MILVKKIDEVNSDDFLNEGDINFAHAINNGGGYFKSHEGKVLFFESTNIIQAEEELGIQLDNSIPLKDYIFESLIDYRELRFENGLTITTEDCFKAIENINDIEKRIYNLNSLEEIKEYVDSLLNEHIVVAFDNIISKIREEITNVKFR